MAPNQLSGDGARSTFNPDQLWFGLLSGLFLPFLALVLIYQYEFNRFAPELLLQLLKEGDMLQSLIALALIPNFLLFFMVLQKQWNKLGRGVVGMTLLWIVAYLFYKYVFNG